LKALAAKGLDVEAIVAGHEEVPSDIISE